MEALTLAVQYWFCGGQNQCDSALQGSDLWTLLKHSDPAPGREGRIQHMGIIRQDQGASWESLHVRLQQQRASLVTCDLRWT